MTTAQDNITPAVVSGAHELHKSALQKSLSAVLFTTILLCVAAVLVALHHHQWGRGVLALLLALLRFLGMTYLLGMTLVSLWSVCTRVTRSLTGGES